MLGRLDKYKTKSSHTSASIPSMVGIVKEVLRDEDGRPTFQVVVSCRDRDDVTCTVSQDLYNAKTKDGAVTIPSPGTHVEFEMNGGLYGTVKRCILPCVESLSPDTPMSANGGHGEFTDPKVGYVPENGGANENQFRHSVGDSSTLVRNGMVSNEAGKYNHEYKLSKTSKRIIYRWWDDDVVPGIHTLKRAYFSGQHKKMHGTVYRQDVFDAPKNRTSLVREEKGVVDDKMLEASHHGEASSSLRMDGYILEAKNKALIPYQGRPIKRTTIFSIQDTDIKPQKKELFRQEWWQDGTYVERGGTQDGKQFAYKKFISPTGEFGMIFSKGNSEVARFGFNPQSGELIISGKKVSIYADDLKIHGQSMELNGAIESGPGAVAPTIPSTQPEMQPIDGDV